MPELLEDFKVGTAHDPGKCPFCPEKKNDKHYRTYGGAENNGTKLGVNVNKPEAFGVKKESDARPKTKKGEEGKDGRGQQSFKDTTNEKLEAVRGKDRDWKFQAHHAISGKQCLQNHPVEKFIKKGDKLKYDTGYSVNNPQNGIWMPCFPKHGNWPDDPGKKFAISKKAMDKFKRQFHLGNHDISVDGLDTKTYMNYVDYIKLQLDKLNIILSDWELCPEKHEENKHLGNPRIHDALDCISDHIINNLKGSPRKWFIFISRHARDYTIKTLNPNAKLDFEK